MPLSTDERIHLHHLPPCLLQSVSKAAPTRPPREKHQCPPPPEPIDAASTLRSEPFRANTLPRHLSQIGGLLADPTKQLFRRAAHHAPHRFFPGGQASSPCGTLATHQIATHDCCPMLTHMLPTQRSVDRARVRNGPYTINATLSRAPPQR